jgi:hypothetical protein
MHGWSEVAAAATWRRLLATAGRSALQQGWAYGAAIEASGHKVCRLAWQASGTTWALAQLLRRRLPLGLGVVLILRGPIMPGIPTDTGPDAETERRMIRALTPWTGRAPLVWQPDDGRAAPRRADARRVWTGASTVLLDLEPPLAAIRSTLHGKWRHMLKRAEAEPLRLHAGGPGRRLDWLIAETERQRRQRRYAGPTPAFTRYLAEAGEADTLCLVAEHQGSPVAGMLLCRHGQSATYQMAATTTEGRRLRAHHRLLWAGIEALKEQGCTTLDLGLVDTESNPGIARFKLGTGAKPLTLAGSYLLPPRLGGGARPE